MLVADDRATLEKTKKLMAYDPDAVRGEALAEKYL